MSSESSFDGQTFNEFDDFIPKPLSSDSDHLDPEPASATICSQAPPPHHLKHQLFLLHQGLKLLQFKVQNVREV